MDGTASEVAFIPTIVLRASRDGACVPPNSSNSSSSYPTYPPVRPNPNSIFLFSRNPCSTCCCCTSCIFCSSTSVVSFRPIIFLLVIVSSSAVCNNGASFNVSIVVLPSSNSDIEWPTCKPCKSCS